MLYNVIVKVDNFTLLCFLFSILDETDFALDQIYSQGGESIVGWHL